jgi:hypothetical protein
VPAFLFYGAIRGTSTIILDEFGARKLITEIHKIREECETGSGLIFESKRGILKRRVYYEETKKGSKKPDLDLLEGK